MTAIQRNSLLIVGTLFILGIFLYSAKVGSERLMISQQLDMATGSSKL